jgi:hypothetical protein
MAGPYGSRPDPGTAYVILCPNRKRASRIPDFAAIEEAIQWRFIKRK